MGQSNERAINGITCLDNVLVYPLARQEDRGDGREGTDHSFSAELGNNGVSVDQGRSYGRNCAR